MSDPMMKRVRDGFSDAAALLSAYADDDGPAIAQMVAGMEDDEKDGVIVALLQLTAEAHLE